MKENKNFFGLDSQILAGRYFRIMKENKKIFGLDSQILAGRYFRIMKENKKILDKISKCLKCLEILIWVLFMFKSKGHFI